jgi:hypothetical protein
MRAASAAPSSLCTDTGYFDMLVIKVDQWGFPHVIGTRRTSYVGDAFGLLTTYRIWHVTFQATASSTWTYSGAFAERCNSSDESTGETDLTRDVDQTLSSFDMRCGTASFTNGSYHYTYVGSRYNDGDAFRYWGYRYDGGMLLFFGVTAARCP